MKNCINTFSRLISGFGILSITFVLFFVITLMTPSASAQNRSARADSVKEPKEKSPREKKREFNRSRKALIAAIAARKKLGEDDTNPTVIQSQFLGESESLMAVSQKDQPPVSKEYAKRLS